jgi:lipoyl(octanoyl) transferase
VIPLEWWGRLDYREALHRQRARRERVIAGAAAEVLALVEHPAVLTLGRRPAPGTPDAATLAAMGIDRVVTERGGLATWHGPGQLVGYVIVDIGSRGGGVRRTVYALEQGVIDWLRARGCPGVRRVGFPGVWVGGDKVCAIGLHFRRGVTMHGFALNLCADLSAYSLFVPCGITDGGVTSLDRLCSHAPTPGAAAIGVGSAVRARLVDTFGGGG